MSLVLWVETWPIYSQGLLALQGHRVREKLPFIWQFLFSSTLQGTQRAAEGGGVSSPCLLLSDCLSSCLCLCPSFLSKGTFTREQSSPSPFSLDTQNIHTTDTWQLCLCSGIFQCPQKTVPGCHFCTHRCNLPESLAVPYHQGS